jgi:subfamily B ATP-binding cassette protein HlyB/CyaB
MTGNSLTLVIDLIFVVVFFSVMFQYSVFMTVVVLIFLLIYFFFWIIVGPKDCSLRLRTTGPTIIQKKK